MVTARSRRHTETPFAGIEKFVIFQPAPLALVALMVTPLTRFARQVAPADMTAGLGGLAGATWPTFLTACRKERQVAPDDMTARTRVPAGAT